MSMFGIMQTLNAYYKNSLSVTISTNSRFRQYIRYRISLIELSHNERIQENKKRDAGLSDSEAKCGILLCGSEDLGPGGRFEKEKAAAEITTGAITKKCFGGRPLFLQFRRCRNASALTK